LKLPWGRGWALSVVHHPDAQLIGRIVPLKTGSSFTLGRGCDALGDGGMADSSISRNHTAFNVSREGVIVEDQNSLNGTTVNGRVVEKQVLVGGDRITIGPIRLLLHRALPKSPVHDMPAIVGVSSAMRLVIESVTHVAPHDTTVTILGESGAGKELVAQAIHERSGRRGKMLRVNCGGIPDTLLYSELFGHEKGSFSGADSSRKGLVETAAGGTLFLDEIGDASPQFQTALLRFLQEGEVRPLGSNRVKIVDTRVVVATHTDLEKRVHQGRFREDLLARINGWVIEVPPLRERKEDIIHLLRHFSAMEDGPQRFSAELIDAMLAYHWPRNVRELQNTVRAAVIQRPGCDCLVLTDAMRQLLNAPPSVRHLAAALPVTRPSQNELHALIKKHRGNIRQLALKLGVARTTLYRWVKEEGIILSAYRGVSPKGVATTPSVKALSDEAAL
jgi:DNA-binding NtrC family response regulator